MINKLLGLFNKSPHIVPSEHFASFPCDCHEQIILRQIISPGQAAVISCDNCALSWTVYNPSLTITKTKELPENLQSVWEKLSNESR